MVSGVGMGAFWVRGPRELVASDDRRLVTVRVLHPSARAATAIRVGRAAVDWRRTPVRAPGTDAVHAGGGVL